MFSGFNLCSSIRRLFIANSAACLSSSISSSSLLLTLYPNLGISAFTETSLKVARYLGFLRTDRSAKRRNNSSSEAHFKILRWVFNHIREIYSSSLDLFVSYSSNSFSSCNASFPPCAIFLTLSLGSNSEADLLASLYQIPSQNH